MTPELPVSRMSLGVSLCPHAPHCACTCLPWGELLQAVLGPGLIPSPSRGSHYPVTPGRYRGIERAQGVRFVARACDWRQDITFSYAHPTCPDCQAYKAGIDRYWPGSSRYATRTPPACGVCGGYRTLAGDFLVGQRCKACGAVGVRTRRP